MSDSFLSISGNAALFALLQRISDNNARFQTSQNAISTGQRVSPVNNTAGFIVAQQTQGVIQGLDAVDRGISQSVGPAVTAIAGANLTSGLLSDATSAALLAFNGGNTPEQTEIFQNDFNSIIAQIDNVSEQAAFGQVNLAAGDPAAGLNVVSDVDGGQTNIASADFSAAGLAGLDTFDITDPANSAQDALSALDAARGELTAGVGQIAADLRQAEDLQVFNQEIQDAQVVGLGAIADTDLAREDSIFEQLNTQRTLQFNILAQQNDQRGAVLNLFA